MKVNQRMCFRREGNGIIWKTICLALICSLLFSSCGLSNVKETPPSSNYLTSNEENEESNMENEEEVRTWTYVDLDYQVYHEEAYEYWNGIRKSFDFLIEWTLKNDYFEYMWPMSGARDGIYILYMRKEPIKI